MVALGELPIGASNVIQRGIARHTKSPVRIFNDMGVSDGMHLRPTNGGPMPEVAAS